MSSKAKIVMIYVGVAVISAAILLISSWTAKKRKEHDRNLVSPMIEDKSEPEILTQLTEFVELINQDGDAVSFADLKGKVWLFAQFYANCPQCAKHSNDHLKKLHERYADNPDFRLVCVSVDPANNGVEELQAYSKSLGGNSNSWLFLSSKEPEKLMSYMEDVMKYRRVVKRTNPQEIQQYGELAHEMSIAVFDRELQMRGKYDLFTAAEKAPDIYKFNEANIDRRVRMFLQQK